MLFHPGQHVLPFGITVFLRCRGGGGGAGSGQFTHIEPADDALDYFSPTRPPYDVDQFDSL